MQLALRLLVATGIGLCLVVGLFSGMRTLVAAAGPGVEREVSRRIVGFVRVKPVEEISQTERTMPKRPDMATPPPIPSTSGVGDVGTTPMEFEGPKSITGPIGHGLPDMGLDIKGGLSLGTAVKDTDAAPLLRIQPEYPARAADQNLEGWVLVRFSIGKLGEVLDPVVVDAQPANVFDEAALRAIRRWKYQPKVRDGKPIARHGMLVRLTFELD